MQRYNGTVLTILQVINKLMAQRWQPMLPEKPEYTELELCSKLKQIIVYRTWYAT